MTTIENSRSNSRRASAHVTILINVCGLPLDKRTSVNEVRSWLGRSCKVQILTRVIKKKQQCGGGIDSLLLVKRINNDTKQ